MLQKKICMLGSFGVGKTSLVSRYVHSIFSEVYHSTIGVKVDHKSVNVDGVEVELLLWDLHGDDDYQRVKAAYLRSMAGYLLVADGTRPRSLEVAKQLQALAVANVGDVPFVLLLNKGDLEDEWRISSDIVHELTHNGWTIFRTSAKTGEQVEGAFENLARKIVSSA